MKKIKNLFVILAFVSLPLLTIGDPPGPPPPPGGGGPGGGGTPVGAPVDGGIGLLLALGLGYGGMKLYQFKKDKSSSEKAEM